MGQLLQPGTVRLPDDPALGTANRPGTPAADTPNIADYHPTFLYESLWCVGVAVLLVWAGRRFDLRGGRLFALYVAAYTVGRAWIEALRVDHANHVLGLRLNLWTSLIIFLVADGIPGIRTAPTGFWGARPGTVMTTSAPRSRVRACAYAAAAPVRCIRCQGSLAPSWPWPDQGLDDHQVVQLPVEDLLQRRRPEWTVGFSIQPQVYAWRRVAGR